MDAGDDAGELWFQQDVTTTHTARESTDWQPHFPRAVQVLVTLPGHPGLLTSLSPISSSGDT